MMILNSDANLFFAKELRKQRKEHSLTQQQLADKLGIARETISHYETGKMFPSVHMLKILSETLSVPASCFTDNYIGENS